MAGKNKDFDATELVKATEDHEHQLKELADRVGILEGRVIGNESFAKSFIEASTESVPLQDTINQIIDKHDNHKLKISGIALLKWLGMLVIGGIAGAFINSQFGS